MKHDYNYLKTSKIFRNRNIITTITLKPLVTLRKNVLILL